MNKNIFLNDMPQVDIQKVNRAISDDYNRLNTKNVVNAIQGLKLEELLIVLMHELRSKQRRSVLRTILTNILKSPEALACKEKYQREAQEGFTILLVGQTGVGKSTTINSMFGEVIDKTTNFRLETKSTAPFEGLYHNVKYTIYDIPDLGEWNINNQNVGEKYLSLVKEQCFLPDILWYVLRLDDNRITATDANAFQLIHRNFEDAIWDRTMIVFTHSDMLKTPEEFQESLDGRTQTANEVVAQITDGKVQSVPAVAVSNGYEQTPDGKSWLGELFTATFERLNPEHQNAFLLSFATNLEISKSQSPKPKKTDINEKIIEKIRKYGKRIELTEEQIERMREKSVGASTFLVDTLQGDQDQIGGTIKTSIGEATLGIPDLVFAIVGGMLGFLQWLWDE